MPPCTPRASPAPRTSRSSNLIRWQLIGAARSTIGDADEERHTGVSAEAYWESRASFWETYFDADRFPTMALVWADGGFDDPAGWDFEQMITRLLDGIEQLALDGRGPISARGSQLERLALVAPTEDAPEEVLVSA